METLSATRWLLQRVISMAVGDFVETWTSAAFTFVSGDATRHEGQGRSSFPHGINQLIGHGWPYGAGY